VTTLANAAEVLRWLKDDRREAGVAEIAAAMGWPKSSASRLLKEMQQLGLLERDAASRQYRVGLLVFELARHYRAGNPLVEAADAAMAELTRRTGHAAGIAVLDGIDVVVLRGRPGIHPLAVFRPPGSRAPAWATSNGRCLLARLPDAEIAARFQEFPSSSLPSAPKSLDELMKRIGQVRAAGWEESRDEANPGVSGVATAVTDPSSGDALALYFVISTPSTDRDQRRTLANLLLEVAGQLAAQFGDDLPFGAPKEKYAATRG
jgi:DNA-binding IclR family transcriptional regulator